MVPTIADVRNHYGLVFPPDPDAIPDYVIQQWIDRVRLLIESELCVSPFYDTYTETVKTLTYCNGAVQIVLPHCRVEKVLEIKLSCPPCGDGEVIFGEDKCSYFLYPGGVIRIGGSQCSPCCTNIERCVEECIATVTYEAGWNPVPYDLMTLFWILLDDIKGQETPGCGAATCEQEPIKPVSNRVQSYRVLNETITFEKNTTINYASGGEKLSQEMMEKILKKYRCCKSGIAI